jgi:hypothetical protein
MSQTVSDIWESDHPRQVGRRQPVLYVAFCADDPDAMPSRHRLEGIEIVRFGRGPRAAVRGTVDGKARLSIQLPDPTMSSAHGELIRTADAWLLDVPDAKNGAVVRGDRVRCAQLATSTVFLLGRTIFMFAHAMLDDVVVADAIPEPLDPPQRRPGSAEPAGGIAELEASRRCSPPLPSTVAPSARPWYP